MSHSQLPISALQLWQSLNAVVFSHTRLAAVPDKGCGLVADAEQDSSSSSSSTASAPACLLSVPRELVLNAEAVEEYAKQEGHFRELLDAVGRKSTRGDILLFLFVHLVIGQGQGQHAPGSGPGPGREVLSVPWTDYVKFLPDDVPVPTLWTDAERRLLQGTSLENAVEAKRIALEYEFDEVRDKSSDLFFWQAVLWERQQQQLLLRHWFLVDAWYRSRSLDLPKAGPSMVPCIDMVNHSAAPNAYYDEVASPAGTSSSNNADAVVLLLRPGQHVAAAEEITISYSGGGSSSSNTSDSDVKSASEMLFSYGFVDPHAVRHHLVLPLRPLPDDPLAKAKLHVSGGPAQRLTVELIGASVADDDANEDDTAMMASGEQAEPAVRWTCPFAYLMCVNEEDGLDFRLQQETDGSTQLRMFWQDEDVTDKAQDFPSLARTHALAPVFQLRVVTVVQEMVEAQLERMQAAAGQQSETDDEDDDGDDDDDDESIDDADVRPAVATQAAILRDIESRILSSALEALEAERSDLLSNATVVAYLGSMEVSQNTLAHGQAPNQGQDDEAMVDDADDDFS